MEMEQRTIQVKGRTEIRGPEPRPDAPAPEGQFWAGDQLETFRIAGESPEDHEARFLRIGERLALDPGFQGWNYRDRLASQLEHMLIYRAERSSDKLLDLVIRRNCEELIAELEKEMNDV